jgi:hypothetical protein
MHTYSIQEGNAANFQSASSVGRTRNHQIRSLCPISTILKKSGFSSTLPTRTIKANDLDKDKKLNLFQVKRNVQRLR